ncbi:MAG: cysteine--tRNA ligase, partial [Treponema sp.]|nr:cysteine--tRNA ligase [Treponema sp.]
SAMSMKYLGEHFDIHTGGIDHIPIHHTNEIAQSEGATGKKWVNYWLHNEFLVIQKDKSEGDGSAKMSKSSGNFLTLQSLIDKGYDPLDYRFFLMGAHYRSQAKFNWNSMDSAKSSRKALNQRVAKIFQNYNGTEVKEENLSSKAKDYLCKFTQALENDLSTPQALSVLQVAIKDGELKPEEIVFLIRKMDSVIGLKLEELAKEINKNSVSATGNDDNSHEGDPEADEINRLVMERVQAKKEKKFEKADEIRNDLLSRGVLIIDTPQGPIWKRS